MKLSQLFLVLLFILPVLLQCTSNKGTESTQITPVELKSYIAGFNFPEDSNKIYRWVNANDSVNIFKHAWGVWAGLTEPTDQVYADDTLLVFETWQGIDEIQTNIKVDSLNAGCPGNNSRTERTKLARPHQFTRKESSKKLIFAHDLTTSSTPDDSASFWVTVSYSPDAACYATTNQILKQSVLNSYSVSNRIGRIPPFPQKSVTIKPSYYVGKATDDLIRIPAVTEPAPDTTMVNGLTWGPQNWPKVVYADVQNKQPKNKKIVPVAVNDKNPDHIASATCNIDDFIYFKVDQKMADHMNKIDSAQLASTHTKAEAGQLAILVAMHVTTKEISNWTWQTFYWVPNPDQVYRPSSTLAASLRPKELKGAASHYALNAGYAMVIPNQPITGGTNKGVKVLFSYNPYLEGGFLGIYSKADTNGVFSAISPISRPYGVQSNCMSCHVYANNDPNPVGFYVSDAYVDINDPFFKKKVQLDFAWSIHDNMIKDVTSATALKKEYIKKIAFTKLKK